MKREENQCYCGNSQSYVDCCGKAHKDINEAKTAEALMRSRYTAYVLADGDYLIKSHHSTTCPKKEKKSIVKWAKSVQWIKLEVLNKTDGLESDETGTVEFKAYFFENSNVQVIHENSYFKKENGYWVYVDAL